jgi:predicted SnoaL-like aldol condensation-catalyzing enzyme
MSRRKDAAIEFLTMVAIGRIREAYDKHIAASFRHHNAWFPGDRQSLLEGMEANQRDNPGKALEVRQVVEEGETVAVFSHMKPNPAHTGVALVHIFRFEGDKIVELWDVGQAVPEDCPNENGMF